MKYLIDKNLSIFFLPLYVCSHHKDIPGIIFNEMTEGYYENGKAVANY